MRDGDVMDGGPAGAGDPVAPVKIYEIRTYQGPGGTIIQSRTDIFGSGREFYATCVWPVEVPGGAVQAQASFEVPGANVVDAFGNFAAASQAACSCASSRCNASTILLTRTIRAGSSAA